LTIFLARNAALWRDEGKKEGSPGGSLPHVWRETGRKVRAQHWSASYEPPSRPAFSGFGHLIDYPADLVGPSLAKRMSARNSGTLGRIEPTVLNRRD